MNRRKMLINGLCITTLGLVSNKFKFLVQSSTLRLFLDRKEKTDTCMRGYLLTQLTTEDKPKVICYVLELPPRDNVPFVSSIPAGTYPVKVRTDGALGWRLELDNVPDRKNVQIHIGNFPKDTIGCLLPGKEAGASQCKVLRSNEAMAELKSLFTVFGTMEKTEITIRDIS
ncbi:hypothetical protein AHMF7605_03430 [Adhaeribacter arboris]|uniref:DUF5675 domain-containing protein n=1 Tax=Adhaeribacter arboris TaxID=2072846 RepID=A0A2T2YAW9_9BACT|nr:DUF5675 family protein [Adhaeribacter arboris]PSR52643.1 hypothetical protein AHMF7605_03430 [Adhaeribacter arboris]